MKTYKELFHLRNSNWVKPTTDWLVCYSAADQGILKISR